MRTFLLALVNWFCRRLERPKYPKVVGNLTRTPRQDLNLRPGEEVEIKSREEIVATLNGKARNRGLDFDCEMLPFCNQRMRVLNVVQRVVDEHTGELLYLPNRSVVLDGSLCQSVYRRGCARSGAYFWREIWLRRPASVLDENDQRT